MDGPIVRSCKCTEPPCICTAAKKMSESSRARARSSGSAGACRSQIAPVEDQVRPDALGHLQRLLERPERVLPPDVVVLLVPQVRVRDHQHL